MTCGLESNEFCDLLRIESFKCAVKPLVFQADGPMLPVIVQSCDSHSPWSSFNAALSIVNCESVQVSLSTWDIFDQNGGELT